MSATPTRVAMRPLAKFTALSVSRVTASADTTANSATNKLRGSGVAWPPLRMWSTRYCCSFGGVSSAATATSIRPHMMKRSLRYGHSICTSRPRIAFRGMHRGHDFVGHRQPLTTLRAVRDLRRGVGFDVDFAVGAQVFQVAGQAAEAVGFGVREAGQIDPVVVDVRLQEARADGALCAELANFRNRHVRFDRRAVALADGRDVVPRGDNPILLGPAREREFAGGAEQHGHAVQPLAIEFFVNSSRQFVFEHGNAIDVNSVG